MIGVGRWVIFRKIRKLDVPVLWETLESVLAGVFIIKIIVSRLVRFRYIRTLYFWASQGIIN